MSPVHSMPIINSLSIILFHMEIQHNMGINQKVSFIEITVKLCTPVLRLWELWGVCVMICGSWHYNAEGQQKIMGTMMSQRGHVPSSVANYSGFFKEKKKHTHTQIDT